MLQLCLGNNDTRLCFFEKETQTFLRAINIQRQKNSSCLEDSQEAQNIVNPRRKKQANNALRADPLCLELMGQRVCSPVQRSVINGTVFFFYCDMLGKTCRNVCKNAVYKFFIHVEMLPGM
jgi:hypothetical protein